MKLLYLSCSLFCGLLCLPSHAQQPLVADTAGYVKGGYGKFTDRFYYGTLTKTDGSQVQAYLPAGRLGYERIIDYFPKPPVEQLIGNGRTTVKMKKIKAMTVHGRSYETVQRQGENTEIMALRVLSGPVDLFAYSQPRVLLVPIPLAAGVMPLAGISLADKLHWYLRRNGVWTEMPRGHFAQLMSSYLVDKPELASKVSSDSSGYRFIDTPAIIAEYNRIKAATMERN